SVDATNGHILAMASTQPYSATSQFNFAANAHRQPGSSFKPYVLATALKQGMNPDTTYYSGASPKTLTLADGTTWTVNNAGAGAGYTDFGCPAAGKPGTTEGESDAWFVGYTPRLSTAVWVGHPESRATTGYGGPTAGPIWRAYMEAAHGTYCSDFPQPQNPMQF